MRKNYLRYCVETAIGLQKAANLNVSKNFLDVSEKYINNEISYDEAYKIISDYYENKRNDSSANFEDKPDFVSLNISKELTNNEKNVLELIKKNKNIKVVEIAENINKSERTVKSILFGLQTKKLIKRINGKRFGYWEINEEQ